MPHKQTSDMVPSTCAVEKAGLRSAAADVSDARRVNGMFRSCRNVGTAHSVVTLTAVRWIRGELIGKGTYGRVYLALSLSTGQPQLVAVKQVDSPQVLRDESDQRQARFIHSVERVSKLLVDLNHRHIVQYLGFEECFGDDSRVLNM